MTEFDGASGDVDQRRGPSGEVLVKQRRLTYREARPWLKRSSVAIGVLPCGMNIRWLPAGERHGYMQQLRQVEGRDCNVAGDVLLYRTAQGATVLVVEEPY